MQDNGIDIENIVEDAVEAEVSELEVASGQHHRAEDEYVVENTIAAGVPSLDNTLTISPEGLKYVNDKLQQEQCLTDYGKDIMAAEFGNANFAHAYLQMLNGDPCERVEWLKWHVTGRYKFDAKHVYCGPTDQEG